MIPPETIYLLLLLPIPAIAIGLFLAGLIVQLYRDIHSWIISRRMHHVTGIAAPKKQKPIK